MRDLAVGEEGGSVCLGDLFGFSVGEDEVGGAGVLPLGNDGVDWEGTCFHNK